MNKQQLAARIWESTNKMRSKIEPNEYKDYILGLIFYKFLSDREEAYLQKTGVATETWPTLLQPENNTLVSVCQKKLGYFMAYEHLFSVWAAKGKALSASTIEAALSDFDRSVSPDRQQLLGGIFAGMLHNLHPLSHAEGRAQMLKSLIPIIADVPTDGRQDYDVPGFIYEYLIGSFAAGAGKKAGEFYTPHEVSVLISQLVASCLGARDAIRIYDPAAGSGSLLITIGKSVLQYGILPQNIEYYAQEWKESTCRITQMNLMMRGMDMRQIHTRCGDALAEDWPQAEGGAPLLMDAVVANPPYSQEWDAQQLGGAPCYAYGTAPHGKADYAFLQHGLWHVKPDGVMAVVLPHGVLFRGEGTGGADGRGEGEGRIRRALVEHNQIEAVIGLPDNIFFGTTIPTVIMLLRRQRKSGGVLFIDASDCCRKAGRVNTLTASHIRRIADCFAEKKTIDGFSRFVSKQEICDNDYNLNIARYVESAASDALPDLYAAMLGGIPQREIDALNPYWEVLPHLRGTLLQEDDTPYAQPKTRDVHTVLAQSADVATFCGSFAERFADFDAYLNRELIEGMMTVHMTVEKERIAAEIFRRLADVPLIDKYEAYQLLDDAWRTIVLDMEALQAEGIAAAKQTKAESRGGGQNAAPPTAAEDAERIIPLSLYAQVYFTETKDKGETAFDFPPKNRAAEKRMFAAAERGLAAASDETIRHLLYIKWIEPLSAQLHTLPQRTIDALEEAVCALFEKYAYPYAMLADEMKETTKSLTALLTNLTGDDYDVKGLAAFCDMLRGDGHAN